MASAKCSGCAVGRTKPNLERSLAGPYLAVLGLAYRLMRPLLLIGGSGLANLGASDSELTPLPSSFSGQEVSYSLSRCSLSQLSWNPRE